MSQKTEKKVLARMILPAVSSLSVMDVRIALINSMFVTKMNGSLLFRLDDLSSDQDPTTLFQPILEEMEWLQLVPAESAATLRSTALIECQIKLNKLLEEEKAYPCYCSPEKLEEEKRRFLSQGKTVRYAGTCRNLSESAKQEFQNQGISPTIRLKVERQVIKFEDMIQGEFIYDSDQIGEAVLQFPNGKFSLNFVTVIDDLMNQVNHVIRKENEIALTPHQILIYRNLNEPPPAYAHVPVILGPDRTLLSSKHQAENINALKNAGYFSPPLIQYLATLGWNPPERREKISFEEILSKFTIDRVGRTAATWDWEKLNRLNSIYLKSVPPEEILKRIPQLPAYRELMVQKGEKWINQAVQILKDHTSSFQEIGSTLKLFLLSSDHFKEEIKKLSKNKDALKLLQVALDDIRSLTSFTLEEVTPVLKTWKEKMESKAINFLAPIRTALIGKAQGPEVPLLMTLLGKEETLKRIEYGINTLQLADKKKRAL